MVRREILEPPWLVAARQDAGLREVSGPQSHPTILQWAKNMGGFVASYFTDDQTPWCALAMNAWLERVRLPLSGRPGSADLLRAKSFLSYGRALDAPCRGAILVFERPGGFHVGLYTGESFQDYRVYGGNQHDAVGNTWIRQRRCLAMRWPDCDIAPTGRVFVQPDGSPHSQNES